jgi:pullulanase
MEIGCFRKMDKKIFLILLVFVIVVIEGGSKMVAQNDFLGFKEQNGKLIFRAFITNAEKVELVLTKCISHHKVDVRVFELHPAGENIWTVSLEPIYWYWYYRYKIYRVNETITGVDPWSPFITSDNKWGMVIPESHPLSISPTFPQSKSVIYELSLRDFTIDPDSGITLRGKYTSFLKEGTVLFNTEFKTGIDHLKELGVNVIQLMPIQDADRDEYSDEYNWGYMPIQHNSPDGWYATRREDETKVKEFAQLVDFLHKEGFKVVMDVVYNHTAENNTDKRINFNVLAPDYYYRTKENGTYWNGSGCGNELKTEAKYCRKFVLDSLKMYVKRYGVDGFRFDLMGLMDKKTMDLIVTELRKIKKDILIYGEPWKGGDSPVDGVYKGYQKGRNYAVFNDELRDAIKGSVFNSEGGFVQMGNERDRIKAGLEGSLSTFTDSPLETINYIACHDNQTFYDKLKATLPDKPEEYIKKLDKLGAFILLTSQGIPFLHSGQEILRTKFGDGNSYNKPDSVNMIRWIWKKKNYDVFCYYRDLIKLRLQHPVFRMETKEEIKNNLTFYEDLPLELPENGIAFVLNGKDVSDSWSKAVILINGNDTEKEFVLPEGKWKLEFDTQGKVASQKKIFSAKVMVPAKTGYILSYSEK